MFSSIIINYYVCEKEVTEIPQWSGNTITLTALLSLAALLSVITKMTCCWRLRAITVIAIICNCCCCFFPVSESVTAPVVKLWHYSVPCHIFYMTPTTIFLWLVPCSNPPTISYPMWVGSLRFICGSDTRWFHLRMSGPQMGLAYRKDAAVMVPVVAVVGCLPSTESCIVYSLTACAWSSSSSGPHASGQIWP